MDELDTATIQANQHPSLNHLRDDLKKAAKVGECIRQ